MLMTCQISVVRAKETLCNIEFTESDVLKLLQNLNSSKSG